MFVMSEILYGFLACFFYFIGSKDIYIYIYYSLLVNDIKNDFIYSLIFAEFFFPCSK